MCHFTSRFAIGIGPFFGRLACQNFLIGVTGILGGHAFSEMAGERCDKGASFRQGLACNSWIVAAAVLRPDPVVLIAGWVIDQLPEM